MPWSEAILIIVLSSVLGLPVLGFTLYWIAEFLGLRVEARKRRLTMAEADEVRAQIARMQAQIDELQSTGERLASVEEQLAFLERLVDQRAGVPQLSSGVSEPDRG